jgi:hypothetical protein
VDVVWSNVLVATRTPDAISVSRRTSPVYQRHSPAGGTETLLGGLH